MNKPMNYAEEQVLKAYRKDKPARPGNLPQGEYTHMNLPQIATNREKFEYDKVCEKVEERGYATDADKYHMNQCKYRFGDDRSKWQ